MTIVYLDQNAASHLSVPKSGSQWEAIRAALVEGFQKQRIFCPMPLETLMESAPCDRAMRVAIDEFFQAVSGGTRFRSYSEILIDATLALIRQHHEAVAFGTIGFGWGARDEAARIAKESHNQTRERMTRRIQASEVPFGAATMSADEIFRSASLDRCGMFWRDLRKFAAGPTTLASDYEIPWLMTGLIARGLTVAEAQRLAEAVRHHRWEAIPDNFFDLRLGSRWNHDSVRGQRPRYDPNDEIDRWRAAVALAHSDLFITDSYIADLCRRARVVDYTPTVVFSTKQSEAILAYLHKTTESDDAA
jgi:hypothetical protein